MHNDLSYLVIQAEDNAKINEKLKNYDKIFLQPYYKTILSESLIILRDSYWNLSKQLRYF